VGTGIQADTEGNTKSSKKRLKIAEKLVPKGLRGKIAVGLDMIQSTLDCERQWNEFVSSTKWDPHISRVCHRVNIGLRERPPNLDDVDSIIDLKREAKEYLDPERTQYFDKRYNSAHQHINLIAKQLTAALFYFEEGQSSTNEKVVGILHCRLSAQMLKQFEKLVNAAPAFFVYVHGTPVNHRIKTVFDLKTFSANVDFVRPSSEKWAVRMHMDHWSSSESISGFSKV